MSTNIERPIFYDGQILASADLGATVDYARDQLARHDRYLHSWGIISGYDVKFSQSSNSSGTSTGQVTIAAGVAIDGRGRELVLAADQILDPTTFNSAHVYDLSNPPTTWYPLYVSGIPPQPVVSASLNGACAGTAEATREAEEVQFTFGPAGLTTNSTVPYDTPGPGDPTDPPNGTPTWPILIGFVQSNGTTFTGAQSSNGNGVSRRLAGVQAARVEASDGALSLQTSPNVATQLLLSLDEQTGLTFGPVNAQGAIRALLAVDTGGNVTIAGHLASNTPVPAGGVSVQSGVATDGMILPLPSGVSASDVSSGSITLHWQVTPIIPDINLSIVPAPPTVVAVLPLECVIDSDLRVHCRVRYLSSTASGVKTTDAAGSCHYFLAGAKPLVGGSSS
jgi:hypothetical protein